MLVVDYLESSSMFDLDAPALWVLNLVETWKCCFLRRKVTLKDYFFLWRSGAWSLLDFPCFYEISWGYHSFLPLVGSHLSVVLPVVMLVGCFHLVETSTVWWLVPCSLLIMFSRLCLPTHYVLWMWLCIRCHTVLGWTWGAPGYHWIYMLSSTVPVAHPFLFYIVCVRWFFPSDSRALIVSVCLS